jgi:hypothetical protein
MPRKAHHRTVNRVGPHHTWLQRKAYHLAVLLRHVWASWRLSLVMQPIAVGIYRAPPVLVVAWRQSLDDAMVYARDESGEVWS